MPGYISQWWDSVTSKYKEVSKEAPFPVTLVGGGAGGAEEVQVTQPLPAGTNNIGKVTVADMPYEELTTSTLLNATTVLGSHATPNSVGYLIQADPDNTDNIIIVNEAVIMLKMVPGQVNVVMIPGFDYASVADTQKINVTAIGRVMPS